MHALAHVRERSHVLDAPFPPGAWAPPPAARQSAPRCTDTRSLHAPRDNPAIDPGNLQAHLLAGSGTADIEAIEVGQIPGFRPQATKFVDFLKYGANKDKWELLEAGRLDGCSSWRLYWHVVLPIARPAAAVLGLLTFMATWNDFFWPLVAMTQQNPTVQVSLSALQGGYVQDYSLVLSGALISTLPVLVVFALMGRQILGGIMQGAVKG
ncbi:MAG: hypothetical protein JWP76_4191 [Dactylosporangium sp.]|nr:hypothetical protein [Dactylosporangium sp.]